MDTVNRGSINAAISKFNKAVDENINSQAIRNITTLKYKVAKYLTDNRLDTTAVRPWNYDDFQRRLFTFKTTSHWFAKPQFLSSWECARFGWQNSGFEVISCVSCGATINSRGNGELKADILISGHNPECGWRQEPCSEKFCLFPEKLPVEFRMEFINRVPNLVAEFVTSIMVQFQDNNFDIQTFFDVPPSIISDLSVASLYQYVFGSESSFDASVVFSCACIEPANKDTLRNANLTLGTAGLLSELIKSLNHEIAPSMPLSILVGNMFRALCTWFRSICNVSTLTGHEESFLKALLWCCLLLSLTGWNVCGSSDSLASSGEAVPTVSPARLVACQLCGRKMDIRTLVHPAGVECRSHCLQQHRMFCPWTTPAADTLSPSLTSASASASEGCSAGWQVVAVTVVAAWRSNEACSSLLPVNESSFSAPTAADTVSKRTNDTIVVGDSIDSGSLDPRQAYKRIKRVLDMTTSGEGLFTRIILPKKV